MDSNILLVTEIKVEVDVSNSNIIDDHLRNSTAVLQDILKDDDSGPTDKFDGSGGRVCQHCGKVYKTASTLHGHCLLKHPADENQVRCDTCDKTYSSSLSFYKHVQYMHRYEHRCNACYRTFASSNLLKKHAEICRKVATPCLVCKKVFDSLLALRNHVKYKHPEEKHKCDLCSRTFTTGCRLANHKAAIHPSGATDCSWCDKTFNSIGALQSHLLYKHTEDGAKCVHCYKVFAKRINLERHLSKNHLFKDMNGQGNN